MKGQIVWNGTKKKYDLKVGSKVLVSSKKDGYLTYLVKGQKHSAILKAGVTEVEVVSQAPTASPTVIDGKTGKPVNDKSAFTIAELFDFTELLTERVVAKKARALIVGGEGGIGKTFTIIDKLRRMGKTNVVDTMPTIEDLNVHEIDDTEEETDDKIAAQMARPTGDYCVVKGHASAASLYRILWENKNRTIIFDDCDAILKDGNAINLLKPALDTYEDCWVSWRTERQGDSDLPPFFKFSGSIIFITNLALSKIDEAVLTRCFKVDVSMTFAQRIERMRSVLPNVMPDVPLNLKEESLKLLEDNMHRCKDVNFRALMNIISIRADETVDDWKRLATFVLLEH